MNNTISPAQLRMNALFTQARKFEPSHNITAARILERELAALVDQVAAKQPNTRQHADALATHQDMLLSLSITSKRKDISKRLRDAAYDRGAESVRIRIKLARGELDLGTSFAVYNLAIDLIISENRPKEGLKWMLKARALHKALPCNLRQRLLHKFWIEYGIAKANYDLGHPRKAMSVLYQALRNTRLLGRYDNFGDLRGIAKCAELRAQIHIDNRRMRAAKKK